MPEIRRELQALRQMALATSASLDADEIVRVVGEQARSHLDADYGAVFLAGHGGADLILPSTGETAPPVGLRELLTRVARSGEPRACNQAADPQLPPEEWGGGEGLRAALAVPLRYGEEILGVLVVGWRTARAVEEETVGLAETLAVQGAAALHSARLYDELRRTTAARDRFFSAMSHDLRTPISAIVGYGELLSDGIAGELSEEQQEMVDRICQVAAHLSELVDDILDLARLDAGRVELRAEPVPVREVVEEAVLEVQPQAREKSLPLRLEVEEVRDKVLRADAVRVRQILVNLLSNAVKFTEEGEVTVRAGVRGPRGWITVRDTGPGLPDGTEEAVFEEFVQAAAGRGSKRKPGSGLGLAVSRRLARAMGGDLTVESTPGAGAAFTLSLPLQRERGERAPPPESSA